MYTIDAEEACLSDGRHVRRSEEGLYKVFNQTASGRYLLVVLVNLEGGYWKIVTAREMTAKERRSYNQVCGRP
jgi:uncharacterized DUF497 family protein